MAHHKKNVLLTLALAVVFSTPVLAQSGSDDGEIEEIIVTARQREETLQDVPVTVAAFTEGDLDRYNISTLTDAAKLVPNLQIVQGQSGNGSNLFLRGVGSSSISAAFDQSVAVNIDGVVTNRGRFIHNAYLDMRQIEVLKGPQSLYFGKSATAGVVSVTTNDPGDELEVLLMGGYEFEHKATLTELVISSPITDTFGARLAVGWSETEEMWENLAPDVANEWRGDETFNTRLTLLWSPSEDFRARLKINYTDFENDGANGMSEQRCADGTVQASGSGFGPVFANGFEDCKFNGNFSITDVHPQLATGLPYGADDGVPFLDQETWLNSLQLDWHVTPELELTSITAWVDLDHKELDVYCYCSPTPATGAGQGFFNGLHRNTYESISQEFRLTSSFDGPLNFMAGFFYQDIEQRFEAYQYAGNVWYLFGLDPVTGYGYDYSKVQDTESEAWSIFVAGYYQITEDLELTAGIRYTDEEKDVAIEIPYMHVFANAILGFLPSGTSFDGIEFTDDNWSPEVALSWHVTDDVTLFAAYKAGFKSGGIDTSALPTATFNTTNPAFPALLFFESEEASGGEIGVKAHLFDGTLRVNATAYLFDYDDLQIQQFNAAIIQYETGNASELRTQGLEVDWLWHTPLEGLTVRGAFAWTDASYEDTFLSFQDGNLDGLRDDLDGEDRERSADIAWTLGASYEFALNEEWSLGLNADFRYSDEYGLEPALTGIVQDDYLLYDAAIRVFSQDGAWEFALIGENLADEYIAYSEGPRPGAIPTTGLQDRSTTTSLGREITLQVRYRFGN